MPTRTILVLAVAGYFLFMRKPDAPSTPTATVSPGGKQQPDQTVNDVVKTVNSFLAAAREIAGAYEKSQSGDGSTVTSA